MSRETLLPMRFGGFALAEFGENSCETLMRFGEIGIGLQRRSEFRSGFFKAAILGKQISEIDTPNWIVRDDVSPLAHMPSVPPIGVRLHKPVRRVR